MRIRELRELARTAGVDVTDVIVQTRDKIDPKFVLGRGKLDDVIVRAMQLDAETLIFDRELTPAQASAIAKVGDVKVIDRTQLILDIFAQRAESADCKLQVELKKEAKIWPGRRAKRPKRSWRRYPSLCNLRRYFFRLLTRGTARIRDAPAYLSTPCAWPAT